MNQLFDPTLVIAASVVLAWLAVAAIVLAACRAAARADKRMAAEDEAVAMAGPMGWLVSQAPPRENVTHRSQQDLHVAP